MPDEFLGATAVITFPSRLELAEAVTLLLNDPSKYYNFKVAVDGYRLYASTPALEYIVSAATQKALNTNDE